VETRGARNCAAAGTIQIEIAEIFRAVISIARLRVSPRPRPRAQGYLRLRGAGFDGAARGGVRRFAPAGNFPGHVTSRCAISSSEKSSSEPATRPRTEMPAWCTVSRSPETSGCHH
jgi:hypothetical protein